MSAPADQQLLFRDLTTRLDAVADEDGLTRFMAEMLRSLLRRKGDGEFLTAVQDAFIAGSAGKPFEERREIAREIVRVVIEKRPEIALAWQALHGGDQGAGAPPPARRRAADEVAPPAAPQAPAPAPTPPRRPAALYEYARAEVLVGHYVADILDRRLGLFRVPEPAFPSPAYRHGPQFFLFDPGFSAVLRRFVTDVLMVQCREPLQRRLYRSIPPEVLNDETALAAMLAEKRPDYWRILLERLTKWAAHHRTAEAKLAAAAADPASRDDGADFAEVDVPVIRPRTFTVLGVSFTLGNRTTTRRMRVRVRSSTEPNADELEALTMITRLRNMGADAGLELPPGCDFLFLRTLLEFDARKYAAAARELVALAGHPETSRAYLFERLGQIEEKFANTLSDAMVLILFAQPGEGVFTFQEMYDICVGTAANREAVEQMRPFLLPEIGRIPRDLAFQVREALKRRYDERTVGAAVAMLAEVFRIMARSRFQHEIEAALTVLASFPVAFAGDADEPVFSRIGHLLHDALTEPDPDPRAVAAQAVAAYAPLVQRLRAGAKAGN